VKTPEEVQLHRHGTNCLREDKDFGPLLPNAVGVHDDNLFRVFLEE